MSKRVANKKGQPSRNKARYSRNVNYFVARENAFSPDEIEVVHVESAKPSRIENIGAAIMKVLNYKIF